MPSDEPEGPTAFRKARTSQAIAAMLRRRFGACFSYGDKIVNHLTNVNPYFSQICEGLSKPRGAYSRAFLPAKASSMLAWSLTHRQLPDWPT